MPDGLQFVEKLIDYGLAGGVIGAVLLIFYRLGNRYVASTEKLHDTLQLTNDKRDTLCERHADSLVVLAGSLQSHNENTAVACNTVRQLKGVAREACHLGRTIISNPGQVDIPRVAAHLSEMERIIDQTREVG